MLWLFAAKKNYYFINGGNGMVGTLIVDLIPRAGVSGTPPGGDTRRSEDGSCGRPRCTVHLQYILTDGLYTQLAHVHRMIAGVTGPHGRAPPTNSL